MLAGSSLPDSLHRFHLYVLSDTNDPSVAKAEEVASASRARWKDRQGDLPAAHGEYGIQGRQHSRFLRPVGRRS
jgi:hypothetical protein